MRLLLLAATLALVACKPDPIEACVEAEKKKMILECEWVNKHKCSSDTEKEMTTLSEPSWRKKCMRQAAGKDD